MATAHTAARPETRLRPQWVYNGVQAVGWMERRRESAMNAPSRHYERVRVFGSSPHHDCCDEDKHPAVIVWPTAMALSWMLVGTIGWAVATLIY